MARPDLMGIVERYLQEHMDQGPHLEVVNVHRSSDGWSDETYLVDFEVHSASPRPGQRVVIRKESSGLILERMNLFKHYQTLKVLSEETSLPVPRPLWFESDASILGNPFFVMSFLPGHSVVPWSREGGQFFSDPERRASLAQEFIKYLVQIHTIDIGAGAIGLTMGWPKTYAAYLSEKLELLQRDYVSASGHKDDPVIEEALCWLTQNQPLTGELRLVHGDYRSGNLLYDDRHIVGILDWELAEIGDPYVDIGYVFAKANRMNSPLLSYLVSPEQFVAAYQDRMGVTLDMARVQYFVVWHHVQFYLLAAIGKNAFQHGITRDLRLYRQGERLPLMRHLVAESRGY